MSSWSLKCSELMACDFYLFTGRLDVFTYLRNQKPHDLIWHQMPCLKKQKRLSKEALIYFYLVCVEMLFILLFFSSLMRHFQNNIKFLSVQFIFFIFKLKFRVQSRTAQRRFDVFILQVTQLKTNSPPPPTCPTVTVMHRCTEIIHLLLEDMPEAFLVFFLPDLALPSDQFSCQVEASCQTWQTAPCPS